MSKIIKISVLFIITVSSIGANAFTCPAQIKCDGNTLSTCHSSDPNFIPIMLWGDSKVTPGEHRFLQAMGGKTVHSYFGIGTCDYQNGIMEAFSFRTTTFDVIIVKSPGNQWGKPNATGTYSCPQSDVFNPKLCHFTYSH